MQRLPHRQSLVTQVSEILGEEVKRKRWIEWLPKERELAKIYQVSRFTLRRALDRLREEGVLETRHGLGTRIALRSRRAQKSTTNASIGVLMPKALDKFRHFTTLFVDDLRTLLFDHGHQLVLHEHVQVEKRRPFELLKKLTNQQRHACWLLIGCGSETQRWFQQNHVPAVVSGTCDAALGLPFVCLDNRALGRHAALTLVQYGHRDIGALLTESNTHLRSGLSEVFNSRSDSGSTLVICEVSDDASSICRAVDRLLALGRRPTALFIAESNIYLTVYSRLTQLGLRIPQDISLLCRDDEPYLQSMLPEPARYSKNPHTYAKLLLAHMLKLSSDELGAHHDVYVIPEFVAGASLLRRNFPHGSF